MMDPAMLEKLVADVCRTPKYSRICCELVRKIGQGELEKRGNYKDALKHTRAKLHQVAGSYQEKPIPYASLFGEMNALPRNLQDPLTQAWCLKAMALHASTRERLPIIKEFYTTILADLPPLRSVLDLGCGLNPLSLPWIPLEKSFSYQACDIYEDMNGFLDCFFDQFHVQGNAEICDLTSEIPQGEYDLALMLKILPCLEQLDKGLPSRLLSRVQAKFIIVSFPIASLGGRSKGMRQNYEMRFRELTTSWKGSFKRFEFPTELAFLLSHEPIDA